MRIGLRVVTAAAFAAVMFGGSLSFAQEKLADLKPLVGSWSGTVSNAQGSAPIDITINEDGTWHAVTHLQTPLRTHGTVAVVDGKARTKNESDGKTGTLSLYRDGSDKETLKGTRDDGSYWTEYQRKK